MIFSLESQFCADLVDSFGHFLWQATLIGAVYYVALRFVSESRPEMRYRLGIVCLLVLASCVPITFSVQRERSASQNAQLLIGDPSSVSVAVSIADATPPILGTQAEMMSSSNGGSVSSISTQQFMEPNRAGTACRQTSVALAAPGNSPSELQQRIDRILGIRHRNTTRWVEAGSAGLIAAVLVGCLMMAAQKKVVAERPSDESTTEQTSPDVEPAALDSLKAEEAKIVGVVVDSDGRPIEGALVDAWTWWKGTEVKTKADGSFVLNPKGDDRERVEIRISKPGFTPYYNHLQTTGLQPTKFVLGNQTFLEGLVTDAEGQPVADAVVRGEQGEKRADGVVIGSVPTTTTTDADGRYRMYVFQDIQQEDKGGRQLSCCDAGWQ